MDSTHSSPSSTSSRQDIPTPNPGPDILSPEILSPPQTADLFSPMNAHILSMSRPSKGGKSRTSVPPPINLQEYEMPLGGGATMERTDTKGLNIPGLPMVREGSITKGTRLEDEEQDGLADLIPSPRRFAFQQALNNPDFANGAPASPAWQSIDMSPRPKWANGSLDVPTFSSLVPSTPNIPSYGTSPSPSPYMPYSETPARRSSIPTPEAAAHGIHARNLSLYFPSPGNLPPRSEETAAPISDMPSGPSGERRPFAGNAEWKFGAGSSGTPSKQPRSKRRGHHHKHSLSHNFFSFLDPTVTNPALAETTEPIITPLKPTDAPQPVPMPLLSSTLSLASTSVNKSDPTLQLYASFGLMEFLIGAGLWVEGQMGGWRCLAGVGYLVVFDALGVGVSLVARNGEGWRSIRRPYGIARILSLLCFVQSLFLVFAAVYIAKESIEQVVLGSAAHDASSGGGHGHAHATDDERPFPLILLLGATVTSIVSALLMNNHAKLVEAVGPLFLPVTWTRSSLVNKLPKVLGNPFTLTVAGSALCVLLGALCVSHDHIRTFDSLVALLLTVFTTSLSVPPTKTFGLILLQTAPPISTSQMTKMRRTLKDLREDRRILSIDTVRCWAITAGTASEPETPLSTPVHSRQNSINYDSPSRSPRLTYSPSLQNSPTFGQSLRKQSSFSDLRMRKEEDVACVMSIQVSVPSESSEMDVLDVTKKICMAMGRCSGRGEVSVGVARM